MTRNDEAMTSDKSAATTFDSAKRVTVQVSIYFGPSPVTIIPAFTFNMSTGGLYLNTDYPFKDDEEVKLVFSLPGHSGVISCLARVAWVNSCKSRKKPDLPYGVGMEFLSLSSKTRNVISCFLDQHDNEVIGP